MNATCDTSFSSSQLGYGWSASRLVCDWLGLLLLLLRLCTRVLGLLPRLLPGLLLVLCTSTCLKPLLRLLLKLLLLVLLPLNVAVLGGLLVCTPVLPCALYAQVGGSL